MKRKYNLLWTGGFDSTFRLCQLSREDCIIQPIYLFYKDRDFAKFELEAQSKILNYLKGCPAEILPVKKVNMIFEHISSDIFQSFNNIRKDFRIGGQYLSMAQFMRDFGYCELGHEGVVHKPGALGKLLSAKVKFMTDENGNYCIDKINSDKDVVNIFGNYYFPIININELQMMEKLKEWGMIDVVSLIRFCQSGTEKPCGMCVSCLPKMSIDAKIFRFSKAALRQGEICRNLKRIDGTNELYLLYYDYYFSFKSPLDFMPTKVLLRSLYFNCVSLFDLCRKFDKLNMYSSKQLKILFKRVKNVNDFVKLVSC